MKLFSWTLHFIAFICLVYGFEYKTICLIDYIPTEDELEGEGREWEGGMGRRGIAWGPPPGASFPPNTGYYGGEADEFEAEEWNGMMGGGGGGGAGGRGGRGGGGWVGMGMGEMDEFEGGGFYGQAGPSPWPGGVTYGMPMFPSNMSSIPPWRRRGAGGGYIDADGEWEDAKKRRRRRRRRRRAIEARREIIMNRNWLKNGMGRKRMRTRRQIGGGFGGGGMWRAPSQHTPGYLNGKLTCDDQSSIHILNVTLGYARTPNCGQAAYYGCQGSSSKATQVLNCQGMIGNCDVTITRHFMSRCGQRLNFAFIGYECIPATRRVDICSGHDSDETGSVVISSPSYPRAVTSPGTSDGDDIVTCECTIRAPADASIHMEYLRAKLPGHHGSCEGDLLLLETPEPSNDGRYMIVSEICGTNYTTQSQDIQDNILRLTFLGGSPVQHTHGGFIGKFTAISSDGDPSLFHMSCEPPPTQPSRGTPAPERVVDNENRNENDGKEKKSPGVLSGVVASLASVILIMGSVCTLLVYRSVKNRRRRRRETRDTRPSFSSSSESADVDPPPPTNTQRFLSKPRQIFRKGGPPPPPPPAAQRSVSPVAPSFQAPSPPTSHPPAHPAPGPSRSIYCIATDVPDDTETNPKLASLSSLPATITISKSPAPPRRKKNRASTADSSPSSSSASPRPSPQNETRRVTKMATDSPYDNAPLYSTSGRVRAETAESRFRDGTEAAGYDIPPEDHKYEEPVKRCNGASGAMAMTGAGVDVHRDSDEDGSFLHETTSYRSEDEEGNGNTRNSCSSGGSGHGRNNNDDSIEADGIASDAEYSSIDEMQSAVKTGNHGGQADAETNE